jgi:predicted metalloprotease with PDZ domain
VTAVPSKKSSIQPGDRVLEINGVKYTVFKTEKKANELFDMLVLDIIPGDEDDDEDEEGEEEEESEEE